MAKTFKILRFDPTRDDRPRFQEFVHDPKPTDSTLECLKAIRDRQDPSLAFRYSCREAVCGACAMSINGRISLACKTIVRNLEGDPVVIEPLPNLEIQKDLYVDLAPFWKAYRFVEPYLRAEGEPPAQGHRISEERMEKVLPYASCIMCACCYAACPAAARDDRYIGPAALAKLDRFRLDPRDRRPKESLEKVDSPAGVWGCDTVFRCNDVCPKGVRPADGIEALRRALVARKVARLFKRDK
jgi:succinate dehydrogenase / fumarate reductase iron-sulfur subunit